MAEPQAQSKPLVERANTWLTVLGAVISLVVGVTQQRPASAVALAIGVVVVLVGVVIFVTTAKTESDQPRFPVKVRRAALAASAGFTVIIATVFVVPASREAIVHNVLGFPSVAQEVRIVDVNVAQNDTAYQVKIVVLNALSTEEWVHDVTLKLDRPCASVAQPGHYAIDAAFQVVSTDEKGTTLAGTALQRGDDGRFYAPVVGAMTECAGGKPSISVKLGVGTLLPAGQHTTITLDVPKIIEVLDTRPVPVPPPPPGSFAPTETATTQESRKVAIAVAMPTGGPSDDPNTRLTVTLFVGESRTQITHVGL